jgi:hypothetical protein
MSRQLNIRSDEAYQIAHDIADRLNITTTDVIVRALRVYGSRMTPSGDGMTPTQRAEFDALTEIAQKAARHKRRGATSDHSDMYDEFGLPI